MSGVWASDAVPRGFPKQQTDPGWWLQVRVLPGPPVNQWHDRIRLIAVMNHRTRNCPALSIVAATDESPRAPVHLEKKVGWHPSLEAAAAIQARQKGFLTSRAMSLQDSPTSCKSRSVHCANSR